MFINVDILIKDNIFDNIDEIRQQGLNRKDYEHDDHPYSGGWKGYRTDDLDEKDVIARRIIEIVEKFYDISSCPFRRVAFHVADIPSCIEKQPLFHNIKWHQDGNYPDSYAGVVYLHPNPPPNSGSCVLDGEKNEIIHIDNVYNRLVCWPSYCTHAATNVFGDGIERGRMTLVFFIHQPEEPFMQI